MLLRAISTLILASYVAPCFSVGTTIYLLSTTLFKWVTCLSRLRLTWTSVLTSLSSRLLTSMDFLYYTIRCTLSSTPTCSMGSWVCYTSEDSPLELWTLILYFTFIFSSLDRVVLMFKFNDLFKWSIFENCGSSLEDRLIIMLLFKFKICNNVSSVLNYRDSF